ncbi:MULTISPECIES: FxsA family protein [Bacillus]|uniref:FxsA family protein n=1 Tax=Bacillus TaxID=1386 RepID=UPI000B4A3651|nr:MULTISPECIES: FxsA family protein [Bacillus]MDH4420764.1 membrane protein FxsA [Bacillus cereus]PER22962.1 membrane protein FxsA [Bacillus cereus]PFA63474.1 membrane protein FxsA [Bacillus sp. AFS015896]PGL86683.1 membrane protein FxsA [Bacillus sp. AFS054943]PGX10065.1 membrane protein FxsA [Bacillus sp. AFS033286]
MKWLLFLLILIPAIEITVLIGSSHLIGLWSTFAMIIFTGVVGVYLAKRQGFKVLREIQSKLNRGEMPGESVLDGIFVFVGGILLVLPGYVTDVMGFIFVIPVTRALLKPLVMKWMEWKFRKRSTIIIQK